ncbi:MAG: hypothetical protein KDC92_13610 [Bacteroidetes bacterium]|nr:hypothetical protein [Bacteroidota bacterium]
MELTIVLVNIVLVLAIIAMFGGFTSNKQSASSLDANKVDDRQTSETFFANGSK